MKTPKQIAKEIERLEACKIYIPKFTTFGDDNIAKLDAQIRTLDESWDEDEAIDALADEDDELGQLVDSARDAISWRDDGGESPASSWDYFKKKK